MSPNDDKPKDSTAVVSVNIDDFTRTRDSVIVSLATLQSAVSDLSRAYINHANTILNRGPSNLDLGGITTSLLENGLLGAHAGAPREGAADQPKRKRKRVHDPNAPKRALTPYFLYMSHNRPTIAKELGPNTKPKEVADEGTRRWANMPDAEKQSWKKLYADNLAIYQEKMKAYKAGEPLPEDDDHTEAAQQLQQGVENAAETSSDDSSSSESEEESRPVKIKEPSPPRSSKRRRTVDGKGAAEPSPAAAKKASPEKNKKRKAAEEKAEKTKKAPVPETPKTDKKKRKSRKSDVNAED